MPPRKAKPSEPSVADKTLVLDNGAYTIKASLVDASAETEPECHVVQNCMARSRDKNIFVGSQLQKCKDFGEMMFRRPVEKGYLVNWEAEKEIWDHEFFDKCATLKVCTVGCVLLIWHADFCPVRSA
jgi:actin-related protein 6